MKVLFAIPYFYDPLHSEFSKTPSGFGYMVKDILDSVSELDEVYVFSHQFTTGYTENYRVLKHTKLDVLKKLNGRYVIEGLSEAVRSHVDFRTSLHYFYYQIDKGAFIKALKDVDPDIIHIHGLTYQTRPFIEVCLDLDRKFAVTLHGLNGLNDSIILPIEEKRFEYEALKMLNQHNVPVTVISTGILNKIKNSYKLDTSNITVILNGTKKQAVQLSHHKSEKYEILCVGSISFHKNQSKLIDAVKKMPMHYRERMHITFVGVDSDNINLSAYIEQSGLKDVADYLGFVPREEMEALWQNADLNAVMSKEEGFGLSMIEGFMYGIPTMTFSDLDAIIDIYNEACFEMPDSRSDYDVMKCLVKCMERGFDRNLILDWGKKFLLENIGQQYSEFYYKVLRG